MKNKLNNPLILVILLLVSCIIAILGTLAIAKLNTKPIQKGVVDALKSCPDNFRTIATKPRNVCESPECITLAHQLLNWRDTSVNPCNNFYKASCGNYIEHTLTQGTRNVKKRTVIKRLIKEFLVENHVTTSKSEAAMKLLFRTCEDLRDETIYHREHNKTMKEVLKDIQSLGPWPMIDKNWKMSKFDLDSILSNMAKIGHYNFGLFELRAKQRWEMYLVADCNDVSYTGEHRMLEIITSILRSSNVAFNETQVAHDIKQVYAFYEELKHNTTGFNKLKEVVPSIQFEKILKNLLHPKTGDWEKLKLKIENAAHVFKRFGGNGKITNGTLSRILANYMVLRFIQNTYPSISYKETVAHERSCEDIVISNLPRATLRAFVQNHFNRKNLKIVDEMVEEIRKTYLDTISNATWLSKEGKRRASLKISKMKKMVGYPEEYDEKGALDHTFETLHTSKSDSFYTVMKEIKRYRTEILMDFIAFNLSMDPTYEFFNVNAFYSSAVNRLSIMVPFIDEPNMDPSYPIYAKYAVTGDILGHEMGHSMDTTGIEWNEDGQYEKWMPKEDAEKYEKRIKCLRDQYDHYDDPDFGRHLDSSKVINEIIADRHGIDASLHTYRSLNITDDPKIIGFENVPAEQMMYHILALDFCAPRSTQSLSDVLITSTHPTNSFRVNGVFSNLKSFSETFNCPVGSPMNRKKKCNLFVDE